MSASSVPTARAGPPARSTVPLDVALALLVAGLSVIGSEVSLEDDFRILVAEDVPGPQLPRADGVALLLGSALPLAFRRVAPVTVLAVVVAASTAYEVLGFGPEPLPLGVLVALYTVAVLRVPLVGGAAAAAYVAVLTTGALTRWAPLADDQYFIYLVAVVATVTLGYGVALSRTRATLAEQRAGELAREQEARTRAAVAQEQARIAREVHDIVAHHLSVIVAQAAAARRVFGTQPETAVRALASVESVGRDALDGLRRLVNLLRTRQEDSERSPQPGLDRLPALLGQVQHAGLPVDLTIRGRPGVLPTTVELNAYRIVQEALTNILKHAGPTRAAVTLTYAEDSLGVEVRDHGRTTQRPPLFPPPDTAGDGGDDRPVGYGLISMQQRAAMLGGELSAGPASDEGFRVAAKLPVTGGAR